jgi:hypothetical protein
LHVIDREKDEILAGLALDIYRWCIKALVVVDGIKIVNGSGSGGPGDRRQGFPVMSNGEIRVRGIVSHAHPVNREVTRRRESRVVQFRPSWFGKH